MRDADEASMDRLAARRSSDRTNQLLLNPFVSYHFDEGWSVGSSPNITTSWTNSGGKWTVPVGGGFGKVVRLGKPIKLDLDAYYNAIRPGNQRDRTEAGPFHFPTMGGEAYMQQTRRLVLAIFASIVGIASVQHAASAQEVCPGWIPVLCNALSVASERPRDHEDAACARARCEFQRQHHRPPVPSRRGPGHGIGGSSLWALRLPRRCHSPAREHRHHDP